MAKKPANAPAYKAPADFSIRQADPESLKPYPKNPRLISQAAIDKVLASVREFGWRQPIVVDEDGVILVGHTRRLAAIKGGYKLVPVHDALGLSDAQKKAYRLADNRTGEESEWDLPVLSAEIAALRLEGFDLGPLGFDTPELRALEAQEPGKDPEAVPEPPAKPVTKAGDLWGLGDHRLMCGDACDLEQVKTLCDGVVPEIANCDPPYGISVVKGGSIGGAKPFGKVHGPSRLGPALRGRVHGKNKGIIQQGVYAPIIGDDTTETAVKSYRVLKEIGVPVLVMWGGNYFANELPPSRCWLVWDKENTGTFADAELAWTSKDAVVRVLRHQWSGLIKASERGQKRVHPTQKPVALAEWVVDTLAPKAKTVLDIFAGSGASLIAAERRSLAWYGMEMAPAYCDVIVRRWEEFTGKKAKLAATGDSFEQTAKRRKVKAK